MALFEESQVNLFFYTLFSISFRRPLVCIQVYVSKMPTPLAASRIYLDFQLHTRTGCFMRRENWKLSTWIKNHPVPSLRVLRTLVFSAFYACHNVVPKYSHLSWRRRQGTPRGLGVTIKWWCHVVPMQSIVERKTNCNRILTSLPPFPFC